MARDYYTAVNRIESRVYASTVHITYFEIALELLVELLANVWLGPTGGVLKSRVNDLAVLTVRVFRHSQTRRTLAENLMTTMSRSEQV